ncbi:MAG: Asp-tRNA(Asn)/Glu-tRNA(Gln) amidotransferase subunit GatC [Candidatus Portnoybacteria bacterium]|nr:Asp-tRNA(Asn)/Glu-tRNA(Gln) amidotransferase subunit GatC [Candidatus Portnoybacteria bacterium]
MIDITHIVKLARIGLSEEELGKLKGELSAILDFVGKLKRADTIKIEPMTGGTTLFNVVRGDELRPADLEGRNKILENSPKRKGDYIEVMAVFE